MPQPTLTMSTEEPVVQVNHCLVGVGGVINDVLYHLYNIQTLFTVKWLKR